MAKLTIALPKPPKRKRFGQVNKRLFRVSQFLVEHPGRWVVVEGMRRDAAFEVQHGRPLAFAPAGAYRCRVRQGVVKLKFVGTVEMADGVRVVVNPERTASARHPEAVEEVAAASRAFVKQLVADNRVAV